MPLTTEEAAINTKVDELIALWEAYADVKAAGTQIMVVPIRANQVGMPTARWANDGATLQWNRGMKHIFRRVLGAATPDRFPTYVGQHPLFWKVTNPAGDLTA